MKNLISTKPNFNKTILKKPGSLGIATSIPPRQCANRLKGSKGFQNNVKLTVKREA